MINEHQQFEHKTYSASLAAGSATVPPRANEHPSEQLIHDGISTLQRDVEARLAVHITSGCGLRPRVASESISSIMTPHSFAYLRNSGSRMSQQDRVDLKAYLAALRQYYDIPEGAPVFPAHALSDKPKIPERPTSRPGNDPRSRADHPWRSK